MDQFEYTDQTGNLYRIAPSNQAEPITGDNIGLAFSVTNNLLSATPIIRISRTVFAIWDTRANRDMRTALIEVAKLKIPELIERGENLQTTDFMLISSDPAFASTLENTLDNLQEELNNVIRSNASRSYQERKKEFNALATNVYSIYEKVDNTVKNYSGEGIFTTSISGTQTQIISQEIRTKEEYHWALMVTSLPFESMDLSSVDSSFPTKEEARSVRERLPEITGAKATYYYLGTISSLTQLDGLIQNHDGTVSNHVKTLKAIHNLRNTYPTHGNNRYIESRHFLGLPDNPPQDAGDSGTAYIDELILIYKKMIEALEMVRDKITAITSRRRGARV